MCCHCFRHAWSSEICWKFEVRCVPPFVGAPSREPQEIDPPEIRARFVMSYPVERYVRYLALAEFAQISPKNHPTIMVNHGKPLNWDILRPETCILLPKVLSPVRPKTWSPSRSWRPGHPADDPMIGEEAHRQQLRMPVEPCVLGCSHLRDVGWETGW